MNRCVVLIKAGETYLIETDKEGSVYSYASIEEGIKHMEDTYNECHSRSVTWSASVILNWMQFQRAVIEITGVEDLEKWLGNAPYTITSVSTMSGKVCGLECKEGDYQEVFEAAKKPRLISD